MTSARPRYVAPAKSVVVPTTVLALAPYRRRMRVGQDRTWPKCAKCSVWTPDGKAMLLAREMYSVHIVDQGSRSVTILGRCRVHGEQALKIQFERTMSPGDVESVWRQLVFFENELER